MNKYNLLFREFKSVTIFAILVRSFFGLYGIMLFLTQCIKIIDLMCQIFFIIIDLMCQKYCIIIDIMCQKYCIFICKMHQKYCIIIDVVRQKYCIIVDTICQKCTKKVAIFYAYSTNIFGKVFGIQFCKLTIFWAFKKKPRATKIRYFLCSSKKLC